MNTVIEKDEKFLAGVLGSNDYQGPKGKGGLRLMGLKIVVFQDIE